METIEMTDDTHIGAMARPVVDLPTELMQMDKKIASALRDDPAPRTRTHHPWLHPTKGWRMFSRPRGTNKRRKLIPQGLLCVFGSADHKPRRAA
jgi:hypothetical protein